MSDLVFLKPPGWPPPKGYADGVIGEGRMLFVGGQIGWDAAHLLADGLIAQIDQALGNILAILAEAGAGPERIVRLVWYLVDVAAYRAGQGTIGQVYRRRMGRHFPAMSLIQVVGLAEPDALVEIEATAIL